MAKQAKITMAGGGEVLIDLFEKDAPNTVANFEKLANSGSTMDSISTALFRAS